MAEDDVQTCTKNIKHKAGSNTDNAVMCNAGELQQQDDDDDEDCG